MGKTGKKGGKRLKKKELAKMLMELFQYNPAEVYDIKRIFRDLKLDTHPAKLLCMDLLEDLAMDDYIKETENSTDRLCCDRCDRSSHTAPFQNNNTEQIQENIQDC